ncbi:hypothetical protein AbraIFM66950_005126 [Aspergillus brasiliensis]|nr:hypothetical protein AbraIFM66950_005126 [Aspergillus brasiliensis]
MPEVLLPWLNGRIDLRTAYTFSRGMVLNFFRDVTEHPGHFGVPAANVPDLLSIMQDIYRLRETDIQESHPDGPDYLVPPPPQSIDRVPNPKWPNARTTILINRSMYDEVPYWALSDLVGLFMSSLGRAPAGANKRNFYLPLTTVCGMWCGKLMRDNPGQGQQRIRPRVYQCTWNDQDDFFLGASRGGFAHDPEKPWLAVVDRARFSIVNCEPLKLADWSLARSPMLLRSKRRGTPFGRCAETYPFRKLLMGCSEGDAERVYGVAVNDEFMFSPHYDDRLSGAAWDNIWNPCANCKELIRIHGGNLDNFLKWTGGEGAPP